MVLKYRHLMLPGAFPEKVISDVDFTDEAVVQCDFPVIKTSLVEASNLQMITNKF